MTNMFATLMMHIKSTATISTLMVFIASGLYLLVIDGADLKTKKLKKELTAVRILGFLYIFGSIIVYILFKYMIPV